MKTRQTKNIGQRDRAARELRRHANPARAAFSVAYFKDSAGETFLGVAVPAVRRIAKQFWRMPLAEVRQFLQSQVHEERCLATEILRLKFQRGSPAEQQQIFRYYIRNRRFICSWDTVDGSAPYIAGCYLLQRNKKLLYELASSERIWDRRIAMVSTLWFIRHGNVRDTLRLARMLLGDQEDLIHKATGWMLREVGKQDLAALKKFLNRHLKIMPRTMLRYAIERFPEKERRNYLRQ